MTPPDLRSHPRLVESWNSTARDYARDSTLVDLLDAAAADHADLPAVRTADGIMLTHGQLASESSRLAQGLAVVGVGHGTPVAVLLDHRPEAVVAIHAIIRAGAYYVPLDARWPARRMVEVLDSLSVRSMVVSAGLEHTAIEVGRQAPAMTSVLVVGEPVEEPQPTRETREAVAARQYGLSLHRHDVVRTVPAGVPTVPSAPVQSGDTAYVIFTSGSTGTPKGVAVRHGSVVNLIDWFNRRNAVGPDDVLLPVAAFSFDLSVYDLFGIPSAGASMLLLPARQLAQPDVVAEAVLRHGVTLWNSAPAAFTLVLSFASLSAQRGRTALRRVFLSGDWIPLDTHAALQREFPQAVLIALGGATEACVWSNDFVVDRVDPSWASIPYGHPMQNSRYYVLRDNLSPCEIDEAGELYIAGDCVAAGYANDAELTAARFQRDPWVPDAQMYRTGDRAKWTLSGWVEFLGRVDSQVKVRGFRIELGEVEQAARQLPGVEEAVAVAAGDPRDPFLALALRTPEPMRSPDVIRQLAAHLPDYMLPSRVHLMTSLPVGPNGKIDRPLLRDILSERPDNPRPELRGN
ncbi:amino acid adenylation domain-containing protein [Kitasatospora kifunensis]|uniref:Surfactin family lipopeptide synthetase A n=1 Tax=Kitasatospora kifunensis TaxID=58351 RepID=A0A7W7VYQ6_KITKI|nr:amino acid adenylation domain-containing protein [Kitasatospora kifunensis]MBB4926910.1 surfactin family lipopeptide synthetase A [Kitasatospora kifunensis]